MLDKSVSIACPTEMEACRTGTIIQAALPWLQSGDAAARRKNGIGGRADLRALEGRFKQTRQLNALHKLCRGRGFPAQFENLSRHTRTEYRCRMPCLPRPTGVRDGLPHRPYPASATSAHIHRRLQ